MNQEWKKVLNAVLDNCTQTLQLLDNIQDGADKERTRKKLEKQYRILRHKVNSDEELTLADIFLLGSCVNLAQISNKNKAAITAKTVELFDKKIIPHFNKCHDMYKNHENDAAVEYMLNVFSQEIDEK